MWVEFLVGSLRCYERFFLGTPVFSSPRKPTFPNSNSNCKGRRRTIFFGCAESSSSIVIIIIIIIIIIISIIVSSSSSSGSGSGSIIINSFHASSFYFSVAVNEKGTTPSKSPPQSPPPNRSLVHPLGQHKLLYILRYDYQLILYAFSTLQIILSRAPHQFVCASSSTSISSSNTPHQDKIKELLVRHRRSLLGKGFYGALYDSPVSPSGKYSANGCFGIHSVFGEFFFLAETGGASNGHTKHFRGTPPPPPNPNALRMSTVRINSYHQCTSVHYIRSDSKGYIVDEA